MTQRQLPHQKPTQAQVTVSESWKPGKLMLTAQPADISTDGRASFPGDSVGPSLFQVVWQLCASCRQLSSSLLLSSCLSCLCFLQAAWSEPLPSSSAGLRVSPSCLYCRGGRGPVDLGENMCLITEHNFVFQCIICLKHYLRSSELWCPGDIKA